MGMAVVEMAWAAMVVRLPGCFGPRLRLFLCELLALWLSVVCCSGSCSSFSSSRSSSLSSVVSSACVACVRSNSPLRPSVSSSSWAYITPFPPNQCFNFSILHCFDELVCLQTSSMMLSNSFCISSFISSILCEGTEMSDISSSNSCNVSVRLSLTDFSSWPLASVTAF